jgi:hypothetical protein
VLHLLRFLLRGTVSLGVVVVLPRKQPSIHLSQTESEWASRYLSEQIVDACRIVFERERLRRIALLLASAGGGGVF